MSRALLCAALASCLLGTSCDDDAAAAAAANAGPGGRLELIEVPAGGEPLQEMLKRELARARGDGHELLVYVGAAWCEPCTRFHDAAKRGELDSAFPKLRLLELDHDRDQVRLRQTGCVSELIPLFARPTEEGRCDAKRRVAGGVRGSGAVAHLSARLRKLLEQP